MEIFRIRIAFVYQFLKKAPSRNPSACYMFFDNFWRNVICGLFEAYLDEKNILIYSNNFVAIEIVIFELLPNFET